MFKVHGKTFNTFEEVETWAWNQYKIESNPDIEPHQHKQACSELETIIEEIEKEES